MENLPLYNNLSDTVTVKRASEGYPRICLENPSDYISVLIDLLPEGDLPLLIPVNNAMYCVKKIRKHPLCLNKILKVRPLTVYLSPTEKITCTNFAELLEVFPWT